MAPVTAVLRAPPVAPRTAASPASIASLWRPARGQHETMISHRRHACLSPTVRDVFGVLTARQEPGGLVRIRQQEIAERLGLTQSVVSRAIGQLRDKGILSERQRKGTVLIHPLLAGYESLTHMVNHLKDLDTFVWPLNFPTGDIRPPRARDARTGTDLDPDPDGGEDAPAPEARPTLRLAG